MTNDFEFKIKRDIILSIPQLNIIDKALECYEEKLMKIHKLDNEQFSYEFYNIRARINRLFEINEKIAYEYEAKEVEK